MTHRREANDLSGTIWLRDTSSKKKKECRLKKSSLSEVSSTFKQSGEQYTTLSLKWDRYNWLLITFEKFNPFTAISMNCRAHRYSSIMSNLLTHTRVILVLAFHSSFEMSIEIKRHYTNTNTNRSLKKGFSKFF